MGEKEEVLYGGVANKGAVVRVGDTVRRPAGPHTEAVAELLRHLEKVGFDGTPRFLGIDEGGREVLSFIPGEVPLPVFPAWSMTDKVLAEVARLLRRFHEAVAGFDWHRHEWSSELADGGELADAGVLGDAGELADASGTPRVLCHNDVCPENVVFQDGRPVALLDFDFAAPGRRLADVAATIGMWAPLRHPTTRLAHPPDLDAIERLVVFARAYGVGPADADLLIEVLDERRAVGRAFVQRHVDAGDPGFIEMVNEFGGEERYRLNAEWLAANRDLMRRRLHHG